MLTDFADTATTRERRPCVFESLCENSWLFGEPGAYAHRETEEKVILKGPQGPLRIEVCASPRTASCRLTDCTHGYSVTVCDTDEDSPSLSVTVRVMVTSNGSCGSPSSVTSMTSKNADVVYPSAYP